ncbi:hypothetical protein AVEN_227242-1 [Araneus ventricosus]|uniref:DUF5641 domain-containing protein n=1 Tax=Araneus ventricosus TaxID=182803 RepID=A0A4Y2IMY9_ARAVE|nr:hypothetical protein AVEN_227242-1 [Araneus ventricosus]
MENMAAKEEIPSNGEFIPKTTVYFEELDKSDCMDRIEKKRIENKWAKTSKDNRKKIQVRHVVRNDIQNGIVLHLKVFERKEEPRWLSGKVSDSGPEVPGSRFDSTEDPSCIGPVVSQIIRSGPNAPGAEAGEGGGSSDAVLAI